LFGTLSHVSATSSQESVVHATPSLQFGAVPAWQPVRALHVSTPLQNCESSQTALLGVCVQLSVPSLQASTVQTTASLQLGGVPAWQSLIKSQISVPLQYAPSLQAALLGVCVQVSVASLQASVVHPTPSPQFGAIPAWQPFTASHVSTPLQYCPSLHAPSLGK